jgi:hypothetical protein
MDSQSERLGADHEDIIQIDQVRHSFPRVNEPRAKHYLILCQSLPENHEYIEHELYGMAEQLEIERRLVGDATTWTLLKEMWLIRGNRNRALISIGLMVCQQMTGVNAIVRVQFFPRKEGMWWVMD